MEKGKVKAYYMLRYCFGRPALRLDEDQLAVYVQMMAALNQSPYDVRPCK